MSQVQVRDFEGRFIKQLIYTNIRLSLGHAPSSSAYDDKFVDYSCNTAWPVVLPSDDGYTLYVNYDNVKPDFGNDKLWVERVDAQNIVFTLSRVTRPRATISGYYSNVFWKGESAFLDLARLCHGQDIRPLCRQSVALSSNGRRNFFMTFNTAVAAGLPPFNPDDFPDYYNKVKVLLDIYAEYGLYLYSSIFPDNGLFESWKDQTQKQQDHWYKLGEIAKQYNNWWGMELSNEIDAKEYNYVDANLFNPIDGVICSSGSRGETGADPMPLPQWDECDFHQTRRYPNSVQDANVVNHPSRLYQHRAILLGESIGFGDKAINPNREDNPRIAKEMAGSARGTACGITFHSQHGGFSELYDAIEMSCANAWYAELV